VKVPGLFELEELDGEELGGDDFDVVGERDDFVVIGELFVGACAEVDVGNGDETDVWGTETGVFVLVEVACCSALEEGQSQLRSQNN
jgi:hypothetical protein